MIYKKVFLFLALFFTFQFSVMGETPYYNEISMSDFIMRLDRDNPGVLRVKKHNIEYTCKISNWGKKLGTGAGVLWLSTDQKAILIAGTDGYLKTDDIIQCKNSSVKLLPLPVPYILPLGRVIDLNIDKGIYLLVVLEDIRELSYTAIVSKFNTKDNIIEGDGFYKKGKRVQSSRFYLGAFDYGGRISENGKYVYPETLGCFPDSFPGVWDIEKKKRVTFQDKDDAVVDMKCQKLFDGKATLEQLGGKLVSGR